MRFKLKNFVLALFEDVTFIILHVLNHSYSCVLLRSKKASDRTKSGLHSRNNHVMKKVFSSLCLLLTLGLSVLLLEHHYSSFHWNSCPSVQAWANGTENMKQDFISYELSYPAQSLDWGLILPERKKHRGKHVRLDFKKGAYR